MIPVNIIIIPNEKIISETRKKNVGKKIAFLNNLDFKEMFSIVKTINVSKEEYFISEFTDRVNNTFNTYITKDDVIDVFRKQ